MRSGIGPEDSLRAAGVDVRHALDGVGKNLQDHLQLRAKYAVQDTSGSSRAATLNTRARGLGYLGISADYAFRGQGPATMAASQVCAFACSDAAEDRTRPDIQFHFQPLSTSGSPAIHLDEYDAFTASVCQLRPTSRGNLTLRPDGEPGIHINAHYLESKEDQACAAASLRAARQVSEVLAQKPGFKVQEVGPGAEATTDAALVDWARKYGESIYHPVGTCKMGPASDPTAVVDHQLKVHGVEGVRVADCAMMPTLVSGNTHAPAQAIGEKAAMLIRAESGRY